MSLPLVTAGVPTYRNPVGLRRTLDCLTRQTYPHLEIIVSDNASPEPHTEQVVGEFQSRDQRIIYHRQPVNIGPAENFRFVLRQARGEFFFWAADDDEWDERFVEVCLAHIGQAASVMPQATVLFRPTGRRVIHQPLELSQQRSPFENAINYLCDLQSNLFYGLHRTETIRWVAEEEFFDFHDYDFVLRQILTHGFETVREPLFTVGVDAETYDPKPLTPRPGRLFTYLPFLRSGARTLLRCPRLTGWEKVRLLFLLGFAIGNHFVYYELSARPYQVKWMRGLLRLMRGLNRFLRLRLPAPLG